MFINPELVEISDEAQTGDEGCLSFPDIFVPVKRGMRAKVRARDLDGNLFEIEGEALFARALQHETDHLNGRLLIDQVGPVKREIIKRKLRKDAEAERQQKLRRPSKSARLSSARPADADDRPEPRSSSTGRHGATAVERRSTRKFEVDIELDAEVERGDATDRLADTDRLQPGGRGDRRASAPASPTSCSSRWRAGWPRPSTPAFRPSVACGSSCAS